jgi:hypothetical protein
MNGVRNRESQVQRIFKIDDRQMTHSHCDSTSNFHSLPDGLRMDVGMDSERKRPGLAFWVTVVLLIVLAYPLGFGPACWLNRCTGIGGRWIALAYKPFAERLGASEPKFVELHIESTVDRQLRQLRRRCGDFVLWYAELVAGDRLLAWDHDRGPFWATTLGND